MFRRIIHTFPALVAAALLTAPALRAGHSPGYGELSYKERHHHHDPEYDRHGYDDEGYDREGYNRRGYDREGFDREGYNRPGYDREGFDREGYNRRGYDREGYDRRGQDRHGKYRSDWNRHRDYGSYRHYPDYRSPRHGDDWYRGGHHPIRMKKVKRMVRQHLRQYFPRLVRDATRFNIVRSRWDQHRRELRLMIQWNKAPWSGYGHGYGESRQAFVRVRIGWDGRPKRIVEARLVSHPYL